MTTTHSCRPLRRLTIAACVVVWLGCGGKDAPLGPAQLYATYTLSTRNGHPLPATVTIPVGNSTITSINSGAAELLSEAHREIALNVNATSESGPFTDNVIIHSRRVEMTGISLTVTLLDGTAATGSFSGSGGRTLTLNAGSTWGTFVFVRRP